MITNNMALVHVSLFLGETAITSNDDKNNNNEINSQRLDDRRAPPEFVIQWNIICFACSVG